MRINAQSKAFGLAAAFADAKIWWHAGSGDAAELAFAVEPGWADAWTVGVRLHVRLYAK